MLLKILLSVLRPCYGGNSINETSNLAVYLLLRTEVKGGEFS